MKNATRKRDNYFSQILSQTEKEAKYDEAAKKLLANKIVLAHILKGCVAEYESCSIEDIAETYIEGEPEISTVGVHKDESNQSVSVAAQRQATTQIKGITTEDSSQTEGTVYYDVRFWALAPGIEDGKEIRLIINVEAQNRFRPEYPLIKRGIYYGCRMISSQYGTVFTNADYEKAQKVYSIWICTNPPREFRNTITRYSIQPEKLVGNKGENLRDYDLMSLIMVCMGEDEWESSSNLLGFLEVLFSEKKTAKEKRKILKEEYDVPMTEQFESEVREMCNLSEGIMEKGIEQGLERGEERFAGLTRQLAELNRTEDIIRAASDKEFRIKLYQEFKL